MKPSSLPAVCLVLSSVAIVAGIVGMPASFLYLASRDIRDITAGTSGFVAGAVLVGSGLISLAILSTRNTESNSLQMPSAQTGIPSKDEWGEDRTARGPDAPSTAISPPPGDRPR
jgi:hypothetical protein